MILKPIMKLAGLFFRFGDRFGLDWVCEKSAAFQEAIIDSCPHRFHPIARVSDPNDPDFNAIAIECDLCGVGGLCEKIEDIESGELVA